MCHDVIVVPGKEATQAWHCKSGDVLEKGESIVAGRCISRAHVRRCNLDVKKDRRMNKKNTRRTTLIHHNDDIFLSGRRLRKASSFLT